MVRIFIIYWSRLIFIIIIFYFKAYIQLIDKLTFQGIVSKFVFVPSKKISQVMPVYKYNSHVSTQSHDILANYMASSVQGYKCYGSLRPRGNTKKPKTPEDMVARSQLWDSD